MYKIIQSNFTLVDNKKNPIMNSCSDWTIGYKSVRTGIVRVESDMKIYPIDNTKEACIELANDLEEHGIKIRVEQNNETELWSVYIISVPNEIEG